MKSIDEAKKENSYNDRFRFRVWFSREKLYTHYAEANNAIVISSLPTGATAEQCTSMKDKNGDLIYENDFVVKSDFNALGYARTRICHVHWHKDWLCWAITTKYGDTYQLSEFTSEQLEISGNIHQDEDLLDD